MSDRMTDLHSSIEDIRARVRELASEAGSSAEVRELEHAIDEAAGELDDLRVRVQAAVRRNPLMSVAMAAAVGYFLGSVGGRR